MRNTFTGLFFALVSIFVLYPLFYNSPLFSIIYKICICAILVFTVFRLRKDNKTFYIVISCAGSLIVLQWTSFLYVHHYLLLATEILTAVFFTGTILRIAKAVFSSREINRDTILGAISVYLMAGIMFSFIYSAIEIAQPNSFKGPDLILNRNTVIELIPSTDENADGKLSMVELNKFRQSPDKYVDSETEERIRQYYEQNHPTMDVENIEEQLTVDLAYGRLGSSLSYFSFVTITTLGYGDITPRSIPARSFATFEAILGAFYLAILIGRLIGIQVSQQATN